MPSCLPQTLGSDCHQDDDDKVATLMHPSGAALDLPGMAGTRRPRHWVTEPWSTGLWKRTFLKFTRWQRPTGADKGLSS